MANWNLYEARMTVDGITERDIQINTIKNSIQDDFVNSPSYFLTLRNGIEQGFNIIEESLIVKNPNKKRAICRPDETIIVGDVIIFDNSNWICTENDTTSEIYDIGIISRCNNTLLFYPPLSNENPISTELISIPCIIGKGSLGLDTNKYVSLPADEYIITIPNTIDSRHITENTRFILSRDAYTVLGIDSISNVGLLNLRVKEDVVNEDDNLELGICNYYSNQHIYTVTIQNSDATKYTNDIFELNVIATDNSIQVLSPTLSYQSSNEDVATVSLNGEITCLSEGTTAITVIYNGVSDSINLTVQVVEIEDNYTLSISGANSIKINQSSNYVVTVFNNGDIVDGIDCDWSLLDIYTSITSQDSASCTVKAGSTSGKNATLRVSKSDDNSVYKDKVINITSIF